MPTIALLAAITEEIKPTLARLKLSHVDDRVDIGDATLRVHGGRVNDTAVVAVTCGIGSERSVAAVDWLVRERQATRIIHLGFAGALDPNLEVAASPSIARISDEAGETIDIHDNGGVTLLTLDRIADSPQVKGELFASRGAALVDMESFDVARRAAERSVTYTPLRAVSDTADMALPAAAAEWVNDDGTPNLGAAMRYVMTHPRVMGTMMKLQQHATRAAEVLAERVAATIHSGR